MSREELQKAYRDAWHSFYSRQHVETILKRRQDRRRRNVARQMLWFRSSFFIENVHPLLGGFFRLKGRRMRSPRFPVESIPTYYWRRTREIALWTVRATALLIEMRYIYHKITREKYRHYMDVAITPDPIGKKTSRRPDDPIRLEVPAPASAIRKHAESSDLKADVVMPDASYR